MGPSNTRQNHFVVSVLYERRCHKVVRNSHIARFWETCSGGKTILFQLENGKERPSSPIETSDPGGGIGVIVFQMMPALDCTAIKDGHFFVMGSGEGTLGQAGTEVVTFCAASPSVSEASLLLSKVRRERIPIPLSN